MLFTTHSVVGAAAGAATGDPYLGFAAGVLSHHVLDAIPHFDQGTFYLERSGPQYLGMTQISNYRGGFSRRDWAMLFIDWAVAAAVFGAVFWATPVSRWELIVLGAFGGLLPDVVDSSPLWSKKLRAAFGAVAAYHTFHAFFHWTVARKEFWLGIATQAALLTVSLAYLLGYLTKS